MSFDAARQTRDVVDNDDDRLLLAVSAQITQHGFHAGASGERPAHIVGKGLNNIETFVLGIFPAAGLLRAEAIAHLCLFRGRDTGVDHGLCPPLEIGVYWSSWEYVATAKEDGGRVYVQIARDGEVTFHEGFLTEKEARRKQQGAEGLAAGRPELTKPMQNYLALHRHSAVRTELLGHADIALRLAVAQIIAGSDLWIVRADAQKANTDAIGGSLAANKAERTFAQERQRIRTLLDIEDDETETLVPRKEDWGRIPDLHAIWVKLAKLSDADVMAVLTFAVAETLSSGSSLIEALGVMLKTDMAKHWSVDETFLDLLRDKEAISACLKEVAGKATADAHLSSTAKVQKKIISDCLDGTRTCGKKEWLPRYMTFPMRGYTKRGGIAAIEDWNAVKKHFA